jgi:peptide/nickel transport system substrate-binding protein
LQENQILIRGKAAIGPFMPGFSWANDKLAPYDYDAEKAWDLLAQAGWKDTGGDGLAEKDGRPLELSLFTWPQRPGQPPMDTPTQRSTDC